MPFSTDLKPARSACEQVLAALRQIIQAIDLHSRYLTAKYGLTGPQLAILQEVSKRGRLTAGELAQAVSLGQATVTGILMRLENSHLIVRERCLHDKRKVFIQTTPRAEELLASAPPPLQEKFMIQFNSLQNWEQSMILSALQRLVTMMGARGLDAAPFLTTDSLHANHNHPDNLSEH